ncbi:hypothetical protein [Spirosoma litoris]
MQSLFESFQAFDGYIKEQRFNAFPSVGVIVPTYEPERLKKLLLNSWAAEYALSITPVVNDEQYLQSSLHWTFPQAYYSVLFSARAFLLIAGKDLHNENNIRREIASLVVTAHYPDSLSFYAIGLPDACTIGRLYKSPSMAEFIRDTRALQIEKACKLLGFKPGTRVYSNIQRQKVANDLGPTTFFDLLSRLRITLADREIKETLRGEEMHVKQFHDYLGNIVNHVNTIHETQIARIIGLEAFRDLVNEAPSYLQACLADRFREIIQGGIEKPVATV